MTRTVLFAPFLPSVIIFCHVIETSNTEDLERMARFVQSLEDCITVSPGVGKLYRLSQVLYNVALLYVEAKANQNADQTMVSVGNEFDLYLNQLGFMSRDMALPGTTTATNDPDINTGQGNGQAGMDDIERSMMQNAQLGDWFSGHSYVMGLVEEDLSVFNTTQQW